MTSCNPSSTTTTVTDSVTDFTIVSVISSVLRVLVAGLESSAIPRLSRTRLRSRPPEAGEFGASIRGASDSLCVPEVGVVLITTRSVLDSVLGFSVLGLPTLEASKEGVSGAASVN